MWSKNLFQVVPHLRFLMEQLQAPKIRCLLLILFHKFKQYGTASKVGKIDTILFKFSFCSTFFTILAKKKNIK